MNISINMGVGNIACVSVIHDKLRFLYIIIWFPCCLIYSFETKLETRKCCSTMLPNNVAQKCCSIMLLYISVCVNI